MSVLLNNFSTRNATNSLDWRGHHPEQKVIRKRQNPSILHLYSMGRISRLNSILLICVSLIGFVTFTSIWRSLEGIANSATWTKSISKRIRIEDTISNLEEYTEYSSPFTKENFECISWREAYPCNSNGDRIQEKDRACSSTMPHQASGYCEIRNKSSGKIYQVMKLSCYSGNFFSCSMAREFFNYKVYGSRLAVEQLNGSIPQGIAFVVQDEFSNVFRAVDRIRKLGCQLPIEVWYNKTILKWNATEFHEGIYYRGVTTNELEWNLDLLSYALYHSQFNQILFLDMNTVVVQDPTFLFDLPKFKETGTIFWPESSPLPSWYQDENSLLWELIGISYTKTFIPNEKQFIIDRIARKNTLTLAMYYSKTIDVIQHYGNINCSSIHILSFAWSREKQPSLVIQKKPSFTMLTQGNQSCALQTVQYDHRGMPLFIYKENTQVAIGMKMRKNIDIFNFSSKFNLTSCVELDIGREEQE